MQQWSNPVGPSAPGSGVPAPWSTRRKAVVAVRDDRELRRASVAGARRRAPTLLAPRESDMFLWECRRHSWQVHGQQGRLLPARLHRIEGPEPDVQCRRSRLQLEVAALAIRKERIGDK